MGLSLWRTITSTCYIFYLLNSFTDTAIGRTSAITTDTFQATGGTFQPTNTNNTSSETSWTTGMYVSISVPITLVLLAVITTVLVIIFRQKRQGDLRQASLYCGNSVSWTVEHNGYKATEKEKEKEFYKPTPRLTHKEEPIYINVQGLYSSDPSIESDRTENIYCNVGYATQH